MPAVNQTQYTYEGVTGNLKELHKQFGVVPWRNTMHRVMQLGWDVKRALTAPLTDKHACPMQKCSACSGDIHNNAHRCEHCEWQTPAGEAAQLRKSLRVG